MPTATFGNMQNWEAPHLFNKAVLDFLTGRSVT
jgi:hypothetical protein